MLLLLPGRRPQIQAEEEAGLLAEEPDGGATQRIGSAGLFSVWCYASSRSGRREMVSWGLRPRTWDRLMGSGLGGGRGARHPGLPGRGAAG